MQTPGPSSAVSSRTSSRTSRTSSQTSSHSDSLDSAGDASLDETVRTPGNLSQIEEQARQTEEQVKTPAQTVANTAPIMTPPLQLQQVQQAQVIKHIKEPPPMLTNPQDLDAYCFRMNNWEHVAKGQQGASNTDIFNMLIDSIQINNPYDTKFRVVVTAKRSTQQGRTEIEEKGSELVLEWLLEWFGKSQSGRAHHTFRKWRNFKRKPGEDFQVFITNWETFHQSLIAMGESVSDRILASEFIHAMSLPEGGHQYDGLYEKADFDKTDGGCYQRVLAAARTLHSAGQMRHDKDQPSKSTTLIASEADLEITPELAKTLVSKGWTAPGPAPQRQLRYIE